LSAVRDCLFEGTVHIWRPSPTSATLWPRRRWVDNIRVDLRETGWEGDGWI